MKNIDILKYVVFLFTLVITANLFVAFAVEDGDPVYGKKVFDHKCASCHGINGDGNSPMSKHVKPAPTNFVSRSYQDSNGKNPNDYSNTELKNIIMAGRKGTVMVGFAETMSMQDIEDVLAYIRSLHEDRISKKF